MSIVNVHLDEETKASIKFLAGRSKYKTVKNFLPVLIKDAVDKKLKKIKFNG